MSTGRSGAVGQNAHGALYRVLFQAITGAFACAAQVSARHRCQSRGQGASRHCTAVWTL
jgi:hypothetical protein